MTEAVGVIASVFVLLSFLFKNATTIRAVNIIGAALFVIYGLSINAFSVWFLNGILIIIHIFFILKERGFKK